MKFELSYSADEKLTALSARLRIFTQDSRRFDRSINEDVKSLNLKYNLSLLISKIILNLRHADSSRENFESIIREYNTTNGATLVFEDFHSIFWVREVLDEIVLPETIRFFIWQVGHYEAKGESIYIPEDKIDMVRCLQLYARNQEESYKLTIDEKTFKSILLGASDEVVSLFLDGQSILKKDKIEGQYFWEGNNKYSSDLRNEITSTLWLLISEEGKELEQFRKYFKCLIKTEIWFNDLNQYLTYDNRLRLSELAVQLLHQEKDLLQSGNEYAKLWLDAQKYVHISIKEEIPKVDFDYSTPLRFIESVDSYAWRSRDVFGWQETRSFCSLALRFVVTMVLRPDSHHQQTLAILKDISRPFLLWILYDSIPRDYPFLIPFLLIDSELTPLAFKLVDKVEIDRHLLETESEDSGEKKLSIHAVRYTESCKIKSVVWTGMFELVLDHFAHSYNAKGLDRGAVLSEILMDLAEKLFSINSSNEESVIRHTILRKLYDEVLKKISSKRIHYSNVYPAPVIRPRLVHEVLPQMISTVTTKLQKDDSNDSNFIQLSSGLLDLAVEMIRVANLRVSDNEITPEQGADNKEAKNGLIRLLASHIADFYDVQNFQSDSFKPGDIKQRKVRRGLYEFGFEIVDWGYLFLNIEDNLLLSSIHQNFADSIVFNTTEGTYDPQNMDQLEKIKLHLKALLIAFIGIKQKSDAFELEGLPVSTTLKKLERWIKDIALKYSSNDLSNSRVNVFEEPFRSLANNVYYQSLSALLFKGVNYFADGTQIEFITAFFRDSEDAALMLKAINMLDSAELTSIISERLRSLDIDRFITKVTSTSELEAALIDAINSSDHWDLAGPLLIKIQKHLIQINHNTEQAQSFLFEVNLLLAFKQKDGEKILHMEIPKLDFRPHEINIRDINKKRFFIALHWIHNEKKYDLAINELRALLTMDRKNIRYAYQLYQAQTLKAINTNESEETN